MPKRKDEQQLLFSDAEVKYQVKPSQANCLIWEMDRSRLEKWKFGISEFQQLVRQGQTANKQGELFELSDAIYTTSLAAPEVDPFSLRLHNFFFFDRPSDIGSDSCLYFAIDTQAHIILYIGQTCQVDRRWSNHHDCKRYVENYKQLHFDHGMPEAIAIAFYWEVPQDERLRRQLELSEILRWRSPFNKENWTHWSTPFV